MVATTNSTAALVMTPSTGTLVMTPFAEDPGTIGSWEDPGTIGSWGDPGGTCSWEDPGTIGSMSSTAFATESIVAPEWIGRWSIEKIPSRRIAGLADAFARGGATRRPQSEANDCSSGADVAHVAGFGFTVAVSHRSKSNGQWQDVNDGFFRCTAWRSVAENASRTLKKGQRVMVIGKLIQRSFETEGHKRTVVEIRTEEGAATERVLDVEAHRYRWDVAPE
jgi:hypothetical protein